MQYRQGLVRRLWYHVQTGFGAHPTTYSKRTINYFHGYKAAGKWRLNSRPYDGDYRFASTSPIVLLFRSYCSGRMTFITKFWHYKAYLWHHLFVHKMKRLKRDRKIPRDLKWWWWLWWCLVLSNSKRSVRSSRFLHFRMDSRFDIYWIQVLVPMKVRTSRKVALFLIPEEILWTLVYISHLLTGKSKESWGRLFLAKWSKVLLIFQILDTQSAQKCGWDKLTF